MKKDLTNKVVVVTGASSGLGKEICIQAAKKGALVIACARRKEELTQLVFTCQTLSFQKSTFHILDLTKKESIDRVAKAILKEHKRIDVLIHAAGFGLFTSFEEIDDHVIDDMFAVNTIGLIHFTKKILPQMIAQKKGHLFFIASQAGKMATSKSTIYSATKFSVLGFANALRLELKRHSIYVTTVNPGPIATPFFKKADPSGEYLKKIDWLVLDPKPLAIAIIAHCFSPKREINAPWFMEWASRLYTFFPHVGDYLAGSIFNKK